MKTSRLQFRYADYNYKSENVSLEYPVPITYYSKLITEDFSSFHAVESEDYPKLKFPNKKVNILKRDNDQIIYMHAGDFNLSEKIAKVYQSKLPFHKISLGRSLSCYVSC